MLPREYYLEVGKKLYKNAKYIEAMEALEVVIAIDPKNALAYIWMALILREQNHLPLAKEAINKAITIDSKLPDAFLGLGSILCLEGNYLDAETVLRKAISLEPNNNRAYKWLETTLEKQKRYKEAEEIRNKISGNQQNAVEPDGTKVINAKTENHPLPATQLEAEENLKDEVELMGIFGELNRLVGLSQVKRQMSELIAYVKIQDIRTKRGLSKTSIVLHCVFLGNPGTGKTTVARIYGKMLKALGLISKGHVVETDRSGLIANYIGQTTNKTDEKIKEALGGVLFIDEAYSLYRGEKSEWDYGSEAIQILLKRMEDFRDDLAVVVAGYTNPMNTFLDSNEGLRSRFATTIFFDDYSPDELLMIFNNLCSENSYITRAETLNKVRKTISQKHENRDEKFGNARYIRTIYESAIKKQSLRLSRHRNLSNNDLMTLLPEDI